VVIVTPGGVAGRTLWNFGTPAAGGLSFLSWDIAAPGASMKMAHASSSRDIESSRFTIYSPNGVLRR
jgi:hypothetical protein